MEKVFLWLIFVTRLISISFGEALISADVGVAYLHRIAASIPENRAPIYL